MSTMPWMSGPKIVEELWLSQKLSWYKHASGFISLKDSSTSASKDAKTSSTLPAILVNQNFRLISGESLRFGVDLQNLPRIGVRSSQFLIQVIKYLGKIQFGRHSLPVLNW